MIREISKKIKKNINQHISLLIWIMTAGCFALLIVSYVFPKKTYITSAYNVLLGEDDQRFEIPLAPGNIITYEMTTPGKPLFGFQPLVTKKQAIIETGCIVFRIYSRDSYYKEGDYITEFRHNLVDISNEQYIFMPTPNYQLCNGNIIIEIFYDNVGVEGQYYPYLVASDTDKVRAITYENGIKTNGSLMCYHVYLKNNYPLVYDMQILLVFLLAIAMTITGYKKYGKDKEIME